MWIALLVVVALATPIGWSYYATQQVPTFYEVELRVEPESQRDASTEMFNNTVALVQNVKRRGAWEATFTQTQINGWLAVDLKENHAHLLDDRVSEPRVALETGRATLAYQYKSSGISTVVSVSFDVYLAEPNVVAVRIAHVRAGSLPMPLKKVLKMITEAAVESGWEIEWRQQGGDPVALVRVPEMRDQEDADKRLHLDTIQVRRGSVFLSGHTEMVDSRNSRDKGSPALRVRVVSQPETKTTRHR